jgi:hypothetical protein
MLQRIEGVDAFLVVQTKQTFEKIKTFRLQMLAESLVDVASLWFPLLLSLAAWQSRPTRHVVVIRRADELEDPHALIYVCTTLENWLSLEHFSKDTSLIC